MQADDAFWAARRVAAFCDGAIRAAVNAGRYSDVRASEHLTTVLIKRRNRIAETYLPAINPIVDPVLDAAAGLSFRNAAVDHAGAAAPRRYTATWYTFDNGSQSSKELGVTTGEAPRLVAPAGLPSAAGAYVRVDLKAEHDTYASWSRPIETYFRREPSGWKLVGLTRLPGR
jgi:hypothetical protein